MSRKTFTYKFTVAKQKNNAKTTHEFFERKPPTIFHIFQFHIRSILQNRHNSPNSHWTLSQHITQNQSVRRYEKKIAWTSHIPIQRKRPKIMKMTVSWK